MAAARPLPGRGLVMRRRIQPLSGNPPRGPLLAALFLVILLALAAAPFLFPGTRALAIAARICVFITLAASYDILLGYTGIVSFAHTMFFGIGAYGVAIALAGTGEPGWGAVLLGTAGGVALAVAIAFVVGLLSLRVRTIFFSMITLAVASFAQILASQLRGLTGGEDGLTFAVPRLLSPAFRLFGEPILGTRIDGRVIGYYLVFAASLLLFLAMLRLVASPFGRVLQAIRENEFRAEALGYRTVLFRALANALAAAVAALAGAEFALSVRYVGPETTLSFAVMIDILLMVVIGGMGTLYGAVLGAVLVVLAQNYLQPLMAGAAQALTEAPLLAALLHPDRWLLWLGLLFVLVVYFFPAGIMGRAPRAGDG
jgi:branched-chain amino acid transport system permease protein